MLRLLESGVLVAVTHRRRAVGVLSETRRLSLVRIRLGQLLSPLLRTQRGDGGSIGVRKAAPALRVRQTRPTPRASRTFWLRAMFARRSISYADNPSALLASVVPISSSSSPSSGSRWCATAGRSARTLSTVCATGASLRGVVGDIDVFFHFDVLVAAGVGGATVPLIAMIASTSAALRSGAECQLRGVFSASASATLNWDRTMAELADCRHMSASIDRLAVSAPSRRPQCHRCRCEQAEGAGYRDLHATEAAQPVHGDGRDGFSSARHQVLPHQVRFIVCPDVDAHEC